MACSPFQLKVPVQMNCAENPFGVREYLVHRREDGLVAVAVDHQVLHFPNSGFTEGRQKRNPTSVAFTLAEFKANGLNGVVAVHEGAEEDLPTIMCIGNHLCTGCEQRSGSSLLHFSVCLGLF